MAGSWRIATLAGIDLCVHWSFALIVFWSIWLGYWQHGGAEAQSTSSLWGMLDGFIFVIAIFAGVTLHEYGHALAARYFGIATRDITLLPFGGIARLEGMTERPLPEFVIAVAGPGVNIAIALLLIPIVWLSNSWDWSVLQQWTFESLPFRIAVANVLLVAFNLLPAFPLDGGRVLRALCGIWLPFDRATQWVSRIGMIMALLLIVAAIVLHNFMLGIVAIVLMLAGQQEAMEVMGRHWMRRSAVRDAMLGRCIVLTGQVSVAQANAISLETGQTDFPVTTNEQSLAILRRGVVVQALLSGAGEKMIGQLSLETDSTVSAELSLESAWKMLLDRQWDSLLVVNARDEIGMVTRESIAQYLAGTAPQLFRIRRTRSPQNAPPAASVNSSQLDITA